MLLYEPRKEFIHWETNKSATLGRDPNNLAVLAVAVIQLKLTGVRSNHLRVSLIMSTLVSETPGVAG